MVNASMQPKRCRIASSTTQFNWFLDEQKHLQLSDAPPERDPQRQQRAKMSGLRYPSPFRSPAQRPTPRSPAKIDKHAEEEGAEVE